MDKIKDLKGKSFCTKVKKAVGSIGKKIPVAVILLLLGIMAGSASAATWTVGDDGGKYTSLEPISTVGAEIGASDWPTYQHDFQRTGYTSEDINLPLSLKWSFVARDLGSYAGLAVVNNVVYFGSSDSKLYALDLGTGSLIWNRTLTGTYIGSPTVVDGIVYVGTGANGIRGKVYAVYAGNGTIKWEYNINSETAYSAPLVYNGTVYGVYGLYWNGPFGVVALSAHDGSYLWGYSDGWGFRSKLAYYNGSIFAGSDSGIVYSFNSATGAINWQYYTDGEWVMNSPSISNGVVYAQGGSTGDNMGKLYAFDANNGNILWTITPNTSLALLTPVTITSDTLYLATYVPYQDERNEFFAIDTVTRAVKWNFGEKLWLTPPVVAGNKVITGSSDNNLYFLDVNNGTVLWQYNFSARVYSVVVSNDVVLVAAGNALYALSGANITGSISGFKINDTNSNGKWDAGEKDISNWTIRLIGITRKGNDSKIIREETFTDATGFYKFDNLPAGRYFVIEKLKKGFIPTGSPVKRIKLAQDENSMNNNFTNRPAHSLDKTDGQSDVDDYEAINRSIDKIKEDMDWD